MKLLGTLDLINLKKRSKMYSRIKKRDLKANKKKATIFQKN
jgi:hypothetical protein